MIFSNEKFAYLGREKTEQEIQNQLLLQFKQKSQKVEKKIKRKETLRAQTMRRQITMKKQATLRRKMSAHEVIETLKSDRSISAKAVSKV
jgi:hypothetical protein